MIINDLRAWTTGYTGRKLASNMCTRVVARTRGILTRARDRLPRGDAGMTTSEYAIGTIAACAFAAVLYQVITSDTVSGALESIIGKALSAQF
ncbi:DUF4244 domain-containing protein [Streptomyces spongiicola]|uniref:DUF4244 domain-containing protein n=1 Tax=Streptomyces spongiicola TaxID=1690221 RepID=A0A2S1Z211_9ACTN|nr:DUF4244 domain-containing protein [Streptomyces spongiicola]AWK10399.1 DUF4244 domain-containing protein [Streptomyces spongiicola]GBQ02991.1 DUF4244 domain-containing protein [Streptomyces spongiicola]